LLEWALKDDVYVVRADWHRINEVKRSGDTFSVIVEHFDRRFALRIQARNGSIIAWKTCPC